MTLAEIEAWLLSKDTTLWGSWNLTDPERLHQAAVWFAQQVNECKGRWGGWHFTHSIAWGGSTDLNDHA